MKIIQKYFFFKKKGTQGAHDVIAPKGCIWHQTVSITLKEINTFKENKSGAPQESTNRRYQFLNIH